MRPGAELLIDPPVADRGMRMLRALEAELPGGSVVTDSYRGAHELLVLYGVGQPARMRIREQHLAAGGHVAMWDLGYWARRETMRVAIDSFHPSAEQIEASPDYNISEPFRLREDADPAGPILLVGIGPKSAVMLGIEPLAWERAKLAELRSRFPGYPDSQFAWRPKGPRFEPLDGTVPAHAGPIEYALRGKSLVVCRHSNVAIDACIAGIPVECEDGAARSLYLNTANPTRDQRARFLRRLSWWQWRFGEAGIAWDWMLLMTGQRSLACA